MVKLDNMSYLMESDIHLKHVPKQTGHLLPSMQKPVNNKIKDYDIIGE